MKPGDLVVLRDFAQRLTISFGSPGPYLFLGAVNDRAGMFLHPAGRTITVDTYFFEVICGDR